MSNERKLIIASALVAFTAGVLWLGAPLIPALLGSVGAAWLLYHRSKRGQP